MVLTCGVIAVTSLNGMSPGAAVPASPATASLIVDLEPNCNLQILAPTLNDPPANYENPDTDGSYQLSWTRPPAAVGPDLLQISAGCGPFFSENADDISDWNATTEGTSWG